ncbi:GNAT family N-acetyltransferase [Brevibacillus choshinensis]|uniref:GNAT family N-acetyltransferase n=1 Tax=Brevibacillus choshinensis TaxID=54911 RepID=UPI002E1E1F7D|nr:GNAT family N-acetyltransferase [Brevibacillus choshinensis]MED4754364.1 GNAT family N-acetyltransferase [Brevibacillus choshinensis]MED4782566.1 GNAT family N-acetyltransferase [Brevibacillus choshinensis]
MPTPFPAASSRLVYSPVLESDFSELLHVYNSNPDFMEYSYGQRFVTVEIVEQDHADNMAFAFANSYSYCLREASSHSLIGIAQFILNNPRDGHPWLGLIMIDSRAQGKGYAKEFLDGLIDWYRENGYTSLHLAVLEKNQAVVPFYETYGFVPYEERVTEKLGRVICMAYPIHPRL